MARARLGFLGEARELIEGALEGARGHRRLECGRWRYLALVQCLAGALDAAESAARESLACSVPGTPQQVEALAVMAHVLLLKGRNIEALDHAREAMALLDALSALEEGESLVRLVYAEALRHAGDRDVARGAIASARDRLLARAARISNPEWRQSFLENVPDNARTLALARAWLDEGGEAPQGRADGA